MKRTYFYELMPIEATEYEIERGVFQGIVGGFERVFFFYPDFQDIYLKVDCRYYDDSKSVGNRLSQYLASQNNDNYAKTR